VFSQFVLGTTASHIEFINLMVEGVTENGVVDAAQLYEQPRANINQQGPEALFLPPRCRRWCGRWKRFGSGRWRNRPLLQAPTMLTKYS
jgi:type I restriction enzyme R subunit